MDRIRNKILNLKSMKLLVNYTYHPGDFNSSPNVWIKNISNIKEENEIVDVTNTLSTKDVNFIESFLLEEEDKPDYLRNSGG